MPCITDVPGVLVGHAQDDAALTGCTAVLTMGGAVAGVDVRGSAPGTRETDLMRPCNLVERVHAVMLAGGSAYGLDAACGAMQFLEERGVGFDTGFGVVPIVGAAVIFDLDIGDPKVRPDKGMGYAACVAASADPPAEGNAGAGIGATVGKTWGPAHAMKGGVGTWAVRLKRREGDPEPVTVGALVVVNALGDVVDPGSGKIIAGAYDRGARGFLQPGPGPVSDLCPGIGSSFISSSSFSPSPSPSAGVSATSSADPKSSSTCGFGGIASSGSGAGSSCASSRPEADARTRGAGAQPGSAGFLGFGGNTTLAVIATDALLDKEGANKVAQMAHDGLARVIRPVHTMYDGDVIFALSTGDKPLTGNKAADITVLGAAAADAVATAVLRAVRAAVAAAGVPAACDVAV
ncbi:MAG: P1 family peptidase [Firmicutes bacterium]|nr:P1 family peptidase [Bacillota bacterium]